MNCEPDTDLLAEPIASQSGALSARPGPDTALPVALPSANASSALRRGVRLVLNSLGLLAAAPFILCAGIPLRLFGTVGSYRSAAYAVSLLPGLAGVLIRRAFYCAMLERCHWDLTVEFGSVLHDPSTEIGRRVWIGAYCILGRCRLGDAVLIASRVSVLPGRYQHRFDAVDVPVRDQSGEVKLVEIGDDCWLGEGSIVMADVGARAVVGAGAVVVKPVSELLVVAGNPARQIGVRGRRGASADEARTARTRQRHQAAQAPQT